MPSIYSAAGVEFPHRIPQQTVKEQVKQLFGDMPHAERLLQAFDNTEIQTRNFCKPMSYYFEDTNFEDRNNEYIRGALEYSIAAIEECLAKASVQKETVTDIVFVSTTGLATPSMDALIINKMKLNPHIHRMPLWGLGCAGGVSGMARANEIAKANPQAVVLLVAVELCSLTLIKNDYSKSNFIGSSLFSDGVAAVLIKGDAHGNKGKFSYITSGSKLYFDSLEIMGWNFTNDGFKVLFSKDIPSFIHTHIGEAVEDFLFEQNINLADIKHFIFHPGGRKVLDAYKETLKAPGDFLKDTREVMQENGNMSSVTVLYVLEKFLEKPLEDGYALMLAMGPGFSSEMVLLKTENIHK